MDTNLQRIVKQEWTTVAQVLGRKSRGGTSKFSTALTLISLIGMLGHPAEAFMAYDCTNRSNIVEYYSLLEPYAHRATDGERQD
jgi:hypothetical protein